ncbi:MAG: lytic transglycosylase domain-containing protein [Syntrophorhabdus sp.]
MKFRGNPFRPAGENHGPRRFFIFGLALFIALTVALAGSSVIQAQGATSKKNPGDPQKRLGDVEKDVMRLQRHIDLYNLDALPDNLTLCDRKIPIFRPDIRERFERELFQMLENKGLITIVIKRYYKYLPLMSEEIARMGVPSDLIYVAVTESYLNPRAVSKASAAGMWQFMKETGKIEGLAVNDCIDDRYNVKKSTHSALGHLKKLNGQFNDWLLAMAAYNAGPNRVRDAIENQGTRDFFDMYLPEETERYIFRILSLKEIIMNRERYGIQIDEKDLYKPALISEVLIEAKSDFNSLILARAMDVSYRTYRINNLHLRKYKLPKGIYRVNVPTEKKDMFIKKIRSYDYISVQ